MLSGCQRRGGAEDEKNLHPNDIAPSWSSNGGASRRSNSGGNPLGFSAPIFVSAETIPSEDRNIHIDNSNASDYVQSRSSSRWKTLNLAQRHNMFQDQALSSSKEIAKSTHLNSLDWRERSQRDCFYHRLHLHPRCGCQGSGLQRPAEGGPSGGALWYGRERIETDRSRTGIKQIHEQVRRSNAMCRMLHPSSLKDNKPWHRRRVTQRTEQESVS